MWYMHDGAPTYFSRAVRDFLSNTYHGRWRGRRGYIAWPPRSPDLKPLDFYLWEQVKTLVYAASVDNKVAVHRRTVDACQTIRNCPGIFELMRWSMLRRVDECVESHGGHFWHLLYSFSYNSQNKCFRTRVDTDIFSCFGMWNSCPKFVHSFQLHSIYFNRNFYRQKTGSRTIRNWASASVPLNYPVLNFFVNLSSNLSLSNPYFTLWSHSDLTYFFLFHRNYDQMFKHLWITSEVASLALLEDVHFSSPRCT
jgi:hypothetical protein